MSVKMLSLSLSRRIAGGIYPGIHFHLGDDGVLFWRQHSSAVGTGALYRMRGWEHSNALLIRVQNVSTTEQANVAASPRTTHGVALGHRWSLDSPGNTVPFGL